MKKLGFYAFGALILSLVFMAGGAGEAQAGGCPTYNAYYNNGYYSTFCYASYAPVPIVYTPPVIPVQTLYHNTYAAPSYPIYFQSPRQYYPYYATPLYTYPSYGYGGHRW